MKVAGRFKPCVHMGCFDLEVFVELNQRSRKASQLINTCLFLLLLLLPFFPLLASLSSSCYLLFLTSIGLQVQWQCPICLRNYSLENIIVDPYFNRITSMVVFFS